MTIRGRAPSFWAHGQPRAAAWALAPAAAAVAAVARARARRPGTRCGVPVLCCGNATVGGAGKTLLALELVARLRARGRVPHVLSRGHGGAHRAASPVRVDPARHGADAVGDEPLLLAEAAPSWVGPDRVAAARAAIAAGADILVMDDGLQNFGLAKDASFLVIDGPAGFGNGFVLPAGPLREDPRAAAARCRAIVLIGEDLTGAARRLQGIAPTLRARLVQDPEAVARLRGRRVIAFAGIGRPEKFFDGLRAEGIALDEALSFPGHHRFTAADLEALASLAGTDGVLATTPKDAARLPASFRARVLLVEVRLAFADARLDTILDVVLEDWRERR